MCKIEKMECGGRENSLHLLRMLGKRECGPQLVISISRMTETPQPSTGPSYVTSYMKSFILVKYSPVWQFVVLTPALMFIFAVLFANRRIFWNVLFTLKVILYIDQTNWLKISCPFSFKWLYKWFGRYWNCDSPAMSVSKRRLCLATSKVVKYSPPLWKLLISWKSFKLFVWGRYCCSRMDNKQTTLNIVLYKKKIINIDMIRNNELNIETITDFHFNVFFQFLSFTQSSYIIFALVKQFSTSRNFILIFEKVTIISYVLC